MKEDSMKSSGLSGKEKKLLLQLLEKHFPNGRVTCYLFGSAARGFMRSSSDIDLLIISDTSLRTEVSHFREDLDDSHIIRNVDVVWHEDAPESLLIKAKKEGFVLWKN